MRYLFEDYGLDTDRRELRRGDDIVPIEPQVFDLLAYLVRHRDHVVSKDDLFAAVWNGRIVSESALTTRINAARTALGDDGKAQRLLRTLRGRGIRFVGDVRVARDATSITTAEAAPRPGISEEREVAAKSAAARGDGPSSMARSTGPERRQLTIMVCDMVASVSLSAEPDPEDMHDRIATFHKAVSDVAARFDGFVGQYLSDSVHVYFGYPAAHEHDAERAVRAGLALLVAVGSLISDVPLQARVGIATGLVVIGEQPWTADARQRVAIGETPTLATKLQAAAPPGEIVIAASTRRLVGRMFDCHALPAITISGQRQPVEAWQVRGEAAGVSRFEARREGALSPLVGRQEEIDLLLRRWDQVKAGEGRVVLLAGEPGIGKSRIAESLLARLEDEPHARLRYFCSPHHTHSALHPFIAQLELAAGFEPRSNTGAKLDRLEALLKPATRDLPRDAGLIAELLGVPADGRYPTPAVSPQQKREMTLAALLDQFAGLAANGPVLIVFEDAHWIDPTSQDLLDRTVARAVNLPVLLLVTARPEIQPTWVGEPHVTMLPLSRLGRRDSAGIIAGVTHNKALPEEVVEQVLAHADGVPLYLEELATTLLESGSLRETMDRYVLDGPLLPLAIPATLQTSLAARLDLLGSVKGVAQIGAAIGRQFSYELVSAVSGLAPVDLDPALDQLTASGLISRQGTPPSATYSFKHALVQDAAYATLVKNRRRQLHASIAKVLVERYSALMDGQPEIVARHFTEAGLASEAIGYWMKAGRIAYARWANREAVKCFEQALHLLEALPETREKLEQTIDLRIDLRNALSPLGEFERIFGCLREAENLARTIGDQRRLGQLSVYMCHNFYVAGHPMEAVSFGQNAQAIGDSLGDVSLQVTGNVSLGGACLFTGYYGRAEACLLKVLQLLEGGLSRERFGLAGYPAVLARALLSWVHTDRGDFNAGIAQCQEAARLAEALDHPYDRAFAWWTLAHLHSGRGELDQAVPLLERGLAITREWHLSYFSAMHTGSLGYAYALSGRMAEGVPLLEHALDTIEAMGFGLVQPLFRLYLAEAYILANRPEQALPLAQRALTIARERSGRNDEARALRLIGDVTARLGSSEDAEGHYRDALALATELGTRPLVAHCYLGLGKLYCHADTQEQAKHHLSVATTMYREMGMSFWLEQAEAAMR